MSAVKAVGFAALVVGGAALWNAMRKEDEPEFVIIPASGGGDGGDDWKDGLRKDLLGWGVGTLFDAIGGGIDPNKSAGWQGGGGTVFDDFLGGLGGGGGNGSGGNLSWGDWLGEAVGQPQDAAPGVPGGGSGTQGLLDLIGSIEAPQGYGQMYGGSKIQPPKPLEQMTVGEVLAYQDRSVAAGSASSAAGRYQVIRGTLRGEVAKGTVSMNDRFSAANQDKIAVSLANGAGLSKYQSGKISEQQFGQGLSRVWASFPVFEKDKRGRQANGQSYYAGDGLNKALTSTDRVLAAIRGI